jgi:hypothetical protein
MASEIDAQCSSVPCYTTPPPGTCAEEAYIICDPCLLNGYTGSTFSGSNACDWPGPFCGTIENNQWFAFMAPPSGNVSFNFNVFNCVQQQGIQAEIYSTNSCNEFVSVSNCWSPGGASPGTVSASGLSPYGIYYLMIDGFAGDVCSFTITTSSCMVPPTPTPISISGPTEVCPGTTSTYTVLASSGAVHTWSVTPSSIGSIISSNPGGTVNINWNTPGIAQVCVTASNPCFNFTASVCKAVTSQSIPFTQEAPINICAGECALCAGTQFCESTPPNGTPVTLTSWQGCDSVVICRVSVTPVNSTSFQATYCAPYNFNLCGVNYTSSGIVSRTCTNWQGCDSTVTVDLAILNPQSVIQPPAVLGCGANATIVLNGSNSTSTQVPNGITTFLWTGPGIIGPTNQALATVNQPGQYCLTVTHGRSGTTCSDTKCVMVTQDIQIPQPPQLAGNQNPCQGSAVQYTVTPAGLIQPSNYTWTTPNGEPLTQINPTTVSVTWNTTTGGQLCVTANNDCGASAPVCLAISVNPLPFVPELSGPTNICDSDSIRLYTINNFQTNVNYIWSVPQGAIFTNMGTSILVNFSGANLSYGAVCVFAQNQCSSPPSCINVTISSQSFVTWSGGFNIWSLPQNWNLGHIPIECDDILIPSGFALVPTGYHALGRTLEVQQGAAFEVPINTTLTIR